ncbi:MAG: methylenetetrahydrofolate reductase [Actinomycetota bacterium]|nr:methylenetetrahydrofolate reductase [Actinomycetota bacterium]
MPSGDAPTQTGSFLDRPEFSVLCEIEPPRRPALNHVRNQIAALKPVTDAFLIPDNHLGRATVSSIAVAREVADQGCASVACVNARDRNLLGFRRDLLTAAAYGVDHFLFVYGDAPKEGRRTEDLTVRGMMEEVRTFGTGSLFTGFPNFRLGTPARWDRPLAWRARADFLVTQITPDIRPLIRWRESLDFDGQVYAGVLVLGSSRMAARVNATIAGITVPQTIVDKLDGNPELGIDLALSQVEEIKESGAFEGVHLVPVGRYREVAERLGAAEARWGRAP